MNSDDFDAFDDFRSDDPSAIAVRAPREDAKRFPCGRCLGTGRYNGARIHQQSGTCFACNGKGDFATPPGQRAKAKATRDKRKSEKLAAVRNKYADNGVSVFLRGAQEWSSFAAELLDRINGGRELSDGQERAVAGMRAKMEAREAKRTAEREAEAAQPPGFAKLVAAFESAAGSLKWPKLRLATTTGEPVAIGRAGENARYPHSLNVTDGAPYGQNQWYGRITTDGRAMLKRDVPEGVTDLLNRLEHDPKATLEVVGKQTGTCGCCGRELTNPDSVAAGIGPICASSWF